MGAFRWTPILGWCAATATSIVLASAALLPVLRSTGSTDEALSTVGQLPAAATSFPVAPLPSESPSASSSPTPRHTRTSSPVHSASPSPSAATTTAAPKVTTEDGWTVTTDASGLRTYVRSFKCAGGQAVIKGTSDGVITLVTATPEDGYAVQSQGSSNNLAVYFTGARSFVIHAVWNVDKPYADISEVGQ